MNNVNIEIFNRDQEKLVGVFSEPDDKRNNELVIFCHGFGCGKNTKLIKTMHDTICQNNKINCFRFDFSGNKDSDGCFGDSCYTKQCNDLKSVIEHFKKEHYEITCVVGHSMGASVALLAAGNDENSDIKSVVAVSPRINPVKHSVVTAQGGDIQEIISRKKSVQHPIHNRGKDYVVTINEVYFLDILKTDIIAAVKNITVPLLIVHGGKDTVVDVEESVVASSNARPHKHKFVRVRRANHMYSKDEHLTILLTTVNKWLETIRENGNVFRLWPFVFFAMVYLVIFLVCHRIVKQPFKLDLGLTWANFSLFSMLSLEYVNIANSVRRNLGSNIKTIKYSSYIKASRAKFFLQWTNLFFIFTVLTIGFRIVLLSMAPELNSVELENPSVEGFTAYKLLCWTDITLISAFIVGTSLRLVVFVDSYGSEFFSQPWQSPWPLSRKKKSL